MTRVAALTNTRVAALILAAGESRRMGRPKARLVLDGITFVERGIASLRAGGCAPIVIVDGAHPLDDLQLDAALVHNGNWRAGPLASLQVGLRHALALAPTLTGLLVHHVERPRVRPETIRALLDAHARAPEQIVQPTHRGQSGHPLLWPRAAFDELLALDPATASARALVHGAWADRRSKLELDDPGVLDNFDNPRDLQ
jgi:CTP:molybdopterin cytidylyltransferase MocA